jgi:hypothetical protein
MLFSGPLLHAEDKNGLRLNVSKKTLDRADNPKGSMGREIDRTMGLKATIKNLSSKELAEGTIECVILIKRWSLSDASSIERYTKSLKLVALKSAMESELLVGDYHIGGHLHGTSTEHVDQLVGWKITIDLGGKKTDFINSSSFEVMNKRAVPARS